MTPRTSSASRIDPYPFVVLLRGEIGGAMKLSLIVPVHNERLHLPDFVKELRRVWDAGLGPDGEVLVVDDGSTDGSGDWLKKRGEFPDEWRLLRHARNRGYGAAIKTGIRMARHDTIAIIDADGTYPIDKILDLARELEGAEEVAMVVGARTSPESRKAIPLLRRPAKWVLNKLAERLTESEIPDLNSGLRVFRRKSVEPYLHMAPDGFSLTTTITLALLTNGHEVRWEGIEYRPRTGQSKIRPLRDTLNFLQLILRTVLYFNPLKFFLPASLLLFLIGGGLLLARIFLEHPFGVATTVIVVVAGLQLLAIGMLADLIDKRLR